MRNVYHAIGMLVANRIYAADGEYNTDSLMSLTGCNQELAELIKSALEAKQAEKESIDVE